MTHKTWTFSLEDGPHTLTLDYSFWTGRHIVQLDGAKIFDRRIMREFGAELEFGLNNHNAALHIDVPGRLGFAHTLELDAQFIPEQMAQTLLRAVA